MGPELRILILEDDPADAELVQRVLTKAGLQYTAVVANDEVNFFSALQIDGFHAVLSDNALPQYSSMEALKLVRATHPHAAFILVTGTVSEEFAVNIIHQGADDYILKTNLIRLPTAIQNAIEKKKVQKQIDEERQLSVQIINSLPGIFYLYDMSGHFLRWNQNLENLSGYDFQEVVKMQPQDFFEMGDLQHEAAWRTPTSLDDYIEKEVTLLTKSAKRIPYLLIETAINYGNNNCLLGIGLDISSSKNSEKELKMLNEQLRKLSQRLNSVREEEQRRIARELHDELGQQITGLKMDIFTLKNAIEVNKPKEQLEAKISEINGLLDDAVKSVRKISSELHPSILDDLGLAAALEWQSDEFSKRFGIKVSFLADAESRQISLNLDIATGIFRMYQESLTNIARHAGNCKVQATLILRRNRLLLTIADNGKGFDQQYKSGKKTLGLLGMRERAIMIGAEIDISSLPGQGTEVNIAVPITDTKDVDS